MPEARRQICIADLQPKLLHSAFGHFLNFEPVPKVGIRCQPRGSLFFTERHAEIMQVSREDQHRDFRRRETLSPGGRQNVPHQMRHLQTVLPIVHGEGVHLARADTVEDGRQYLRDEFTKVGVKGPARLPRVVSDGEFRMPVALGVGVICTLTGLLIQKRAAIIADEVLRSSRG